MSTFANVYTGAAPNDGTGTPLRNAFQIIDLNFANIANGSANITVSSPVNSVAGRQGNVLLSVDDVYGAVGLDYVDAALVASNVYVSGVMDSFTTSASDNIYNTIADNLASTISDQAAVIITSSHVLDPLTGFNANLTAANVNIQNLSNRLDIAADDITSLILANASSYTGITTLTGQVATLTSNAGAQGHSINVINSSIGDINNSIDSLTTTADDVNTAIGTLLSNAAAQATSLNTINANLGTATNNISALFAANVIQDNKLNTLRADLTAANLTIASLNSASISQLISNINAVNATITAANSIVSGISTTVAGLAGNAGIQANQINMINANVAAANVAIQNIYDRQQINNTDITTLIGYNTTAVANAAAQAIGINTINANVAAANVQINAIDVFLGEFVDAFNTDVNHFSAVDTDQQGQIDTLSSELDSLYTFAGTTDSNVNLLSALVSTSNANAYSYTNTLNSRMIANVNAANAAIITANTAMKSYVDAKTFNANVISSNLVITSGGLTGSTTTGALVLTGAGGAAIGGNINIGGALYVGQQAQQIVLTSALGIYRGTSSSGPNAQFTQLAIVNSTNTGSSDLVAYPNNISSDQAHGWVDVGIAGDAFNDPVYTITKPNDSYLFGSGANTAVGGNLVIATDGSGSYNDIVFATGGFATSNEVGRIHGNTLHMSNIATSSNISVGGSLLYSDGSKSHSAKWTLVETINLSNPVSSQTVSMSNSLTNYINIYNELIVKIKINNGQYVYHTNIPTVGISTSEIYTVGTGVGSNGSANTVRWANTSAYISIGIADTATTANVYIYAR